jgi:hypothetical protein
MQDNRPNDWTVQAREPGGDWTTWSAWVDRATAEAEKANALDEGFHARIVRAS